MKITRDADGLRFIGQFDRESGFVPGDILCICCSRRIDPHAEDRSISLVCSGCGFEAKTFWSEADMHVYMAENWGQLRRACSHPSISMVQDSQ